MYEGDPRGRFERYRELLEKQDHTREETEEMKRLLYQVDRFIALKDGKPTEQFKAERQATAVFYKQAKERGISEVGFVLGGIAASNFAEGLSEAEFFENWTHFAPELAHLADVARTELTAMDLWPWQ